MHFLCFYLIISPQKFNMLDGQDVVVQPAKNGKKSLQMINLDQDIEIRWLHPTSDSDRCLTQAVPVSFEACSWSEALDLLHRLQER